MRNNIRERWNNRLYIHKSSEHVDVLVLKTEFNLAWNYFNANELSKTIFGYWKTWLSKADKKEFFSEFPAPPEDDKHQIVVMPTDYLYVSMRGEEYYIPDICKLDILKRKIITSRKHTCNLLDLASLWKKTVLELIDTQILEEEYYNPLFNPTPPVKERMDEDSDLINYSINRVSHLRISPNPVSRGWQQAHW